MTIKIVLEFGSVEAAQMALAKLVTPAKVTEVLAAPQAPAVAAAEAGAESPATEQDSSARSRKMRSDAGKPRGPYKQKTEGSESGDARKSETADEAGIGTPTPSEGSIPSPAAPSAKPLTVDDAKAALKRLADVPSIGTPGAIDHLRLFGVSRISDMATKTQAEIAEFIKQADEKAKAKK